MPNPSPRQRSAPGLRSTPALAIARRPPPAAQAGAYNDSASEGSLTIDHTRRIVDARGKLQSLLGVAAPPQAGRRLADWCPDAGLLAAVDSAAASDRPHRTMLVRTGLDGRVRHLLVQVVPFGPAPSALLVLLGDATRQVQDEDDLMVTSGALDAVADGVVVIDAASGRVRRANAPAQLMLGIATGIADAPSFGPHFAPSFALSLAWICERLRGEDGASPAPQQLAARLAAQGQRHLADYRYRRPDGVLVDVELSVQRQRLVRRDVLVLVLRDIGDRLRHAAALRAASARCAITFSQAATGLAHVGLDGRWARVNLKLAALLGYGEQELLTMPVAALTHPDDRDNDARVYRRLLAGELPYSIREKRYLRKDGSLAWVSVTSSLGRDEQGAPACFICIIDDIGERKRAEERIRHLAVHDALTGLPNRAGLHEHLERALDAAGRARRRLGVVFLDMDKLKTINDTAGHEAGDRALVAFARHLQQVVRSGDLVARLGGDEFVMVLEDVASRADIDATLRRTLRVAGAARLAGAPALQSAPSCSVGVSVYPDDGADVRTLIRNADLAMYRAKQRGGGVHEYFSVVDGAGPFATLPTSPETTR